MGVKVTFLREARTAAGAQAGGRRPALLVPKAAVRAENGQAFVFVVRRDDTRRAPRRSRPAARTAIGSRCVAGLTPGEQRRRLAAADAQGRRERRGEVATAAADVRPPEVGRYVSREYGHERRAGPHRGRAQVLHAAAASASTCCKGVNLDIPQGDFLALMGPSGSGKTTLLNLMGGLDTPTGGSRRGRRRRASTSSAAARLSRWRAQHIGFVFQLYNLLPVLTAERNVELPLLLTKLSKSRARASASAIALQGRRPRRSRQALPAAALGRPGAARRHRPRHRHRPDAAAVRRADRRSRSQGRRRDPRPAAGAQPRARQDHRHGDARSARRRAREADAAPREGHAARGRWPHEVPAARLAATCWRRKVRTIFTLLSIFVAFLLFGMLMTIRAAFALGVELAGLDRLVVIHKVSLIMPLPVAYQAQLAGRAGRRGRHAQHLVRRHLSGSDELLRADRGRARAVLRHVPGDPAAAGADEGLARRSAGRGRRRDLAKRFGWKIGDRIPLQGTIYRPKNGSDAWEFNLVGIYDGEPGVDKTQFFFRYDYLDENRASSATGTVGWYVVKIEDASKSQRDGARRSTRCSPTRRPRRRRRPRRGSSRASPSRSATSARS